LKEVGKKPVFLLDAGVPVMVGDTLRGAGHEVYYYADVLFEGASDTIVAANAVRLQAVLIAIDKDMKAMPRRYGVSRNGTDDRFANLSLIHFHCPEPLAAKRLEFAMSFVENEWSVACQKKARRMWIEIGKSDLRTHR